MSRLVVAHSKGTTDENESGSYRVPFDTAVSTVIESPFKPTPPAFSASRHLRVCVPDEWYRRSRSRSNSTISYEPSEDTVKRLADLQESDDETDEGDGTARLKSSTQTPVTPSTSARFTAPSDWRNSIAQNRLSNIFDSWIHSSSPTNSTADLPPEKKTVSEPKLILRNIGESSIGQPIDVKENTTEDPDLDVQEFEEMLVSYNEYSTEIFF